MASHDLREDEARAFRRQMGYENLALAKMAVAGVAVRLNVGEKTISWSVTRTYTGASELHLWREARFAKVPTDLLEADPTNALDQAATLLRGDSNGLA